MRAAGFGDVDEMHWVGVHTRIHTSRYTYAHVYTSTDVRRIPAPAIVEGTLVDVSAANGFQLARPCLCVGGR